MIAEITILRPKPGAAVVELRGEHDLANSTALHDVLTSLVEDNALVVIDLSVADFIDSSTLRALLQARDLAHTRGSRVRLQLGTAAIVRKALEVSGVRDLFECVPDRERALRDA